MPTRLLLQTYALDWEGYASRRTLGEGTVPDLIRQAEALAPSIGRARALVVQDPEGSARYWQALRYEGGPVLVTRFCADVGRGRFSFFKLPKVAERHA